MSTKIPVTVITGFLGAGKTTLLRHLLANAKGRRLALIINEFGEQGVDRELLLSDCGDAESCRPGDVIELANGCLCCKVADDFLPTIETLLAREPRPDHIVVETSGLALPKPLVKALAWPEVKARLTVDGVIALVDGPAAAAGRFAEEGQVEAGNGAAAVKRAAGEAPQAGASPAAEHESPLAEVFEDQLACADLVIVNKRDAMSEADVARVEALILEHARAGVPRVETRFARIDADVVLGRAAGAEDDLDSRPSHIDGAGDHDHDDFESFAVELAAVADPEAFARKLEATISAHDVLRVKGFLEVPGKPRRLALQAVGPRVERYFDRAWGEGESRRSRLVVIGRTGLDRAAIAAALRG